MDVAGGYFEDPVALKSDGTLWKFLPGAEPRQIGSDADWKKVVAGPVFFLALKQGGTIWGWGTNEYGVLATNSYGRTNFPDPFRIWQGSDWVDVFFHSTGEAMAVKRDGTLWQWGFAGSNYSAYHQLIRIDVVGPGWSSFAASYDNLILGVRADGTLWAGRYNLFPYAVRAGAPVQNLFGEVIPRDTLTKFARVGTRTDWAGVSQGGDHFLAKEADGTLWAIRCYTLETKRPSKYRDWLAASAESGLDWALAKDGTISCWAGVFRIGHYNGQDPYHGFSLSLSRRPVASLNILDETSSMASP